MIYVRMLLITAVTGIGGLALGGALTALLRSPSDRAVSLLLRFTAGVMLSVVCFDLVADAAEESGTPTVLCWLLVGYLFTYLLNCWVDRQARHTHAHGGEPPAHERTPEDDGELCACGQHTLHTAGLVLAAAVALHNMPVGMAIGATFANSAEAYAGVLAALIIGLHNIPEGMSIAAPLIAGGAKPPRAVGVAALSGVPTVLGALLGYFVGAMDAALLSISLSFAAGAMLYVVFGELLPESERLWRHRLSGLATMAGLLLGLALILGGRGH